MINEFQIGEERIQPDSAEGKGAGERFTGGDEARRNMAADEYADSARTADRPTPERNTRD